MAQTKRLHQLQERQKHEGLTDEELTWKELCISKSASGFYKKMGLLFPKAAKRHQGGGRVSWEVSQGSK